MSRLETMETLRRETFEAEPKIYELIALSREIMLRDPSRHQTAPGDINLKFPEDAFKIDKDEELGEKCPSEMTQLDTQDDTFDEIEKFGLAILEEAFTCLGEDAPAQVRLLLADQDKNCEKVCDWLVKRIDEIGKSAIHQFDDRPEEGIYEYPPIRISPKFIGQYPDPQVNPTCLGKSILAASFFQKSGLPFFQASIGQSIGEHLLRQQFGLIESLERNASREKIVSMPSIEDAKNYIFNNLFIHRGFHAAVYTKIGQSWAQIDPNYGSVISNFKPLVDIFDETHETIAFMKENSDHKHPVDAELPNKNWAFYPISTHIKENPPSPETIDDILSNASEDDVYGLLISYIFKDFLIDDIGSLPDKDIIITEPNKFDMQYLMSLLNLTSQDLQGFISSVLASYIFTDSQPTKNPPDKVNPENSEEDKATDDDTEEEYFTDGDISKSLARCKTDIYYRRRIVDDLRSAPDYLLLKLYSYWTDEVNNKDPSMGDFHTIIDGIDPAYGIGISALSDIAGYYGDELPLSSWLAYWPSKISLVEHRHQIETKAQKRLAEKALKHYFPSKESILTYSSSAPIIIGALSNLTKEMSEEDDDS